MNIEIKVNDTDKTKELYLEDEYQASWGLDIDTFEVIVPYALEQAYIMGKKAKAQELKDALGLN